MRCICFVAVVAAVLFPIAVHSADPPKTDTAKPEAPKADATKADLNGTWVPETAQMAGGAVPNEIRTSLKLVLKDDKYTVTIGGMKDQGTCKVDATTTPKSIDIQGTDGPNKGKTILAIYELDGDKLKVCYDLGGTARPTEFKSTTGSQLFLVTYKREKP